MKEENVMKKTIKSALSKGVSAMLNRTLTSGANASSSYFLNQPVEPTSLRSLRRQDNGRETFSPHSFMAYKIRYT